MPTITEFASNCRVPKVQGIGLEQMQRLKVIVPVHNGLDKHREVDLKYVGFAGIVTPFAGLNRFVCALFHRAIAPNLLEALVYDHFAATTRDFPYQGEGRVAPVSLATIGASGYAEGVALWINGFIYDFFLLPGYFSSAKLARELIDTLCKRFSH